MNSKSKLFSLEKSQTQIYTFYFYRDPDGRWYVDFPEYIDNGYGSKANLEMVAGADNMLEHFATNGEVMITFSNRELDQYDLSLKRVLIDPWGATYVMGDFPFKPVWLCNVSKFIFKGKHPRNIYLHVHEEMVETKHY